MRIKKKKKKIGIFVFFMSSPPGQAIISYDKCYGFVISLSRRSWSANNGIRYIIHNYRSMCINIIPKLDVGDDPVGDNSSERRKCMYTL